METIIKNKANILGLFENSIDIEKEFMNAATIAISPNLKKYFIKKAQQRERFIHEFRIELIKSDELFEDSSGSLTGDLHRTWINIKNYFSKNDDQSLLEDTIRTEKIALLEFEEILTEGAMSLEIRNIIRKQYFIIKKDLETITSLEDVEKIFT